MRNISLYSLSFYCILLICSLGSAILKADPGKIATTKQSRWTKVENSKVCMVTDKLFPRDQIPVSVGKKTYFGCCENCKQRLAEDEKVRFAIDSISGKQVDKAKASIAANEDDGSVAYFENDENLEKFLKAKI